MRLGKSPFSRSDFWTGQQPAIAIDLDRFARRAVGRGQM
jgi:hypothetical protein